MSKDIRRLCTRCAVIWSGRKYSVVTLQVIIECVLFYIGEGEKLETASYHPNGGHFTLKRVSHTFSQIIIIRWLPDGTNIKTRLSVRSSRHLGLLLLSEKLFDSVIGPCRCKTKIVATLRTIGTHSDSSMAFTMSIDSIEYRLPVGKTSLKSVVDVSTAPFGRSRSTLWVSIIVASSDSNSSR